MDTRAVLATMAGMSPRDFVAIAVVVAVVVLPAGCAPPDCNTLEPAYAGEASDEVWRELLDARADAVEGGDAAVFTAPAADAVAGPASSPTFTWDSPLDLAHAGRPSSTTSARDEARAGALRAPRRARPTDVFDRLAAWVLPAAHAHLPPVTDDVYFLEIDVPGRCPVGALTTGLSFAFDDAGWRNVVDPDGDGVVDAGARTARLLSAFVTENNVTEGPFLATPLAFTVEP